MVYSEMALNYWPIMNINRRLFYGAIVILLVISHESSSDTSNLQQVEDGDMLCIYENMDYWTCHWPSQPGVTYTLTVTALTARESERMPYDCHPHCENQTCHCYIPKYYIHTFSNHSVVLNAKSADTSVVSYFRRYANISMARSGPVSDLKLASVNTTTLTITWGWPRDLRYIVHDDELSYNITYYSEWGEMLSLSVTKKRVKLRHLEPYTNYMIHVQALIEGSPHVGNITSIQERTLEAVPTDAPVLVTYRRQNSSCVLVYWQPIPRRHQNGEMLEYVLTMATHGTQYDDVTMMLSPVELRGALFNDIDSHSSYNLTLRGRNTAGWSPHHELMIPPANDVPDPFTEIYGESSSDGTSLTFFWRKSSEIEQLVLMSVSCPDDDVISCQANMAVTPLDLTVGQYSVANPDPQRRYGAVAIVGGVNTGLAEQWACLFTHYGVPAEPSLSVLNTTHTSISVSGNRGACSPHLGDNQGLTLSLQLMYGVDDVCDTEGHVYKDLEGTLSPAGGPYHYTLGDLKPDTKYTLCLQALGRKENSSLYIMNERTNAVKFGNTAIVMSVLVAVVIVFIGIVKMWQYLKKKLNVRVEKPDLSLFPGRLDDLEDDIEMPEVYKGLLDKLHSNDSGYGDSESGNSRYPSSKQSEIQSSGTGTLPNDSSGSYTDAYRDSLISHCSTSALFEDGDT